MNVTDTDMTGNVTISLEEAERMIRSRGAFFDSADAERRLAAELDRLRATVRQRDEQIAKLLKHQKDLVADLERKRREQ